jgi:hypothetical protein
MNRLFSITYGMAENKGLLALRSELILADRSGEGGDVVHFIHFRQ